MRMIRIGLAVVGVATVAGTAIAIDRAANDRPAAPVVAAQVQAPMALVPGGGMPVALGDPFADDPAFADMRRSMAEMDARMAAMMRAGESGQGDAPGMTVSIGGAPGSVSYSYVSTSTGPDGCTQTVRMTSTGDGAKPKVVRTSAGDCGTEAPDTSGANRMVSEPAKPAPETKQDRRDTI